MLNANAPVPSDFLLTNEAARVLDVSAQTIRVERSGRLPALKTEKGVRLFNRAAVAGLAEQLARDATGGKLDFNAYQTMDGTASGPSRSPTRRPMTR